MTTTADVPVPAEGAILVELTINREPMPAPRPRSTSRGPAVFLPDSYTAERDALRLIMRSAMRATPPASGPVELEILWVRTNHRKADTDNLEKLLLDAGNGVLYDDDSQVLDVRKRIRWGEVGRTWLRLRAMDPEAAFE